MASSLAEITVFAGRFETAAAARFDGAKGVADICGAMTELAALAEGTLDRLVSPEERSGIACRQGCPACCRVNVAVLLPEAIAIALRVRELAAQGDNGLPDRIAAQCAKVRWMDDDERIRSGVPCVFLDERGMCVVHRVRPFVCRALSSTDPERCRRALDPYGLDEDEGILVNLTQKFIMEGAFRSLGNALEKLGLDARSVELARGVRGIIADSSLAGDFLSGQRVVGEARFG